MARKADFITISREKIKDLVDVLDDIKALNREYTANGGSSWLAGGDFTGANADITKTNFDTAFGNAATLDSYVTTQNYDDTFYLVF